jgi:hypothetical protein
MNIAVGFIQQHALLMILGCSLAGIVPLAHCCLELSRQPEHGAEALKDWH